MKCSDEMQALDHVDLDGYSRSEGFLGYFSSRDKVSWENAQIATSLLFESIGPEILDASIFTSLHVDMDAIVADGGTSSRNTEIVRRLVDHGVLSSVDYSKFGTDYDSDFSCH